MTHEEFISLVKQPETVNALQISDLKELVDRYPYFAPAHLIYTKALQISNDIHYESCLNIASIYSPSRRWFYYYLHPGEMLSNEPYRRQDKVKSSGAYFDMIKVVEAKGGDTKQSLKNLAERLKSARSMVVNIPEHSTKKIKHKTEIIPEEDIPTITVLKQAEAEKYIFNDYFSTPEMEISEINAKKLIAERKYKDAIEILRCLNLNNPKKSVYFADQIRFLEKVIENSKK